MKIYLTPGESEKIFYNALCNGLQLFSGYGLELTYDSAKYQQAKKTLQITNPTSNSALFYEDVLMELLKSGESLIASDIEGDGEYTSYITLQDIHTRVSLVEPIHIINIQEEQDDADDADAVLQTVFWGKPIFG
jgi:hypothetical protein